MHLHMEEVAMRDGHKVSVEVGDNSVLIVGNRGGFFAISSGLVHSLFIIIFIITLVTYLFILFN
jgi:hypothetical protein